MNPAKDVILSEAKDLSDTPAEILRSLGSLRMTTVRIAPHHLPYA
jgi:hypothetical protein